MPIVRAVDTGFGHTKFTRAVTNGQVETASYPSIAPIATGTSVRVGGVLHEPRTVEIRVDDETYAVGPDAIFARQAWHHQTRDNSFASTGAYMALTLGAVYYMREPVIDRLVVGLPLNTYNEKRDELRRRLVGKHRLPNFSQSADAPPWVDVTIERVNVMPQPTGALLYHATQTAEGQDLQRQTSLVLDLGYFTLDYLVTRGTMPFANRSGATEGGMSAALDALDKAVGAQIRAERGFSFSLADQLHLYEEALRDPAMVLPTAHGPIDLKPFLPRVYKSIEAQLAPALTRIGNSADIVHVILAGGGASFLKPLVEEKLPGAASIFIDDEPAYSNVLGFYRAGLQWEAAERGGAANAERVA